MPLTNDETTDAQPALEPVSAWRDVHVALATGLRYPDQQLRSDVASGAFARELSDIAAEAALDPGVPFEPPVDGDRDLTGDYVALFEAAQTPYAPPAESPYKPWYGDRSGGLMEGPPAAEMEERYRAIDATVPRAYPPDHVALLLEYGSYLLEAGEHQAYRTFVATHLDWIPAFRRLTATAAAEAPFYRWIVALTAATLEAIRDRLGIASPGQDTVETMLDRADTVYSSH
jgi:TorA maturation chaperone TorD